MSDLTAEEQAHVRLALRVLWVRCGAWDALAKALKINESTIRHIAKDHPVSASLAFRLARFVKIGVDDLLDGKFAPPGTCPYCGHCPSK